MKVRRMLHVFGNHVVAMNNRNSTLMYLAVKILAIAYVVIAAGLIYWGLVWMGSHMGPPRWIPDTETFIKTNHVEGVEGAIRRLIHGEPLCRSDIDMLLALDYVPIKCLLLGSSWLDVDSKLAIYKVSSISEKQELYTALRREEQDTVDVLEGKWITHVLYKVGQFLEWIRNALVFVCLIVLVCLAVRNWRCSRKGHSNEKGSR